LLPFETRLNSEYNELRRISEQYPILDATPVDEDGKPYPKRITGYDLVPDSEHDTLTAVAICKLWKMTPDEAVASLSASEFMRRAALAKASEWSQPTKASIARNKEERLMRRR
jgi:hypothetical protein